MPNATNILPQGIDSKTVREWANANGFEVAGRGRFSHEVISAFVAAQAPVVVVESVNGVAVSDMSVPF